MGEGARTWLEYQGPPQGPVTYASEPIAVRLTIRWSDRTRATVDGLVVAWALPAVYCRWCTAGRTYNGWAHISDVDTNGLPDLWRQPHHRA